MKKYRNKFYLFVILIFILYFFPINGYMFKNIDIMNILFVIYPLSYFITSMIEARYSGNFYIFPIITSIFYIPLTFTIFSTSYLPCFFIYLIAGLLGGLFGYWCYSNEEVRKSFKKAIGIVSIIGTIFASIAYILNIFLYKCLDYYCTIADFFTASSLQSIVAIILLIVLAWFCFRKKKKKKDKDDNK